MSVTHLLVLVLKVTTLNLSSNELAEVLVVVLLRVFLHLLHVLSHLQFSRPCVSAWPVLAQPHTGVRSCAFLPRAKSMTVKQRRLAALRLSQRTRMSSYSF